jgi:hypothetical protein
MIRDDSVSCSEVIVDVCDGGLLKDPRAGGVRPDDCLRADAKSHETLVMTRYRDAESKGTQ